MKREITRKIKDTLPNTLHELLKVALDDLESVSKRDDYKVNMEAWRDGVYETDYCEVGLAVSIMARLTGYDSKTTFHPIEFKASLGSKFLAIEALRRLELDRAFCYLYTVNEYRRFYKREKLIDQICGKEIRKKLENLEETVRRGIILYKDFTYFEEATLAYRYMQKELKSLGV